MRKRHALFFLLLGGSPSLFAQTSKDSTVRELNEVVVTATRYPVKQSQTGKVVIVIPHSELEKNSGKSLGLLLSEQAGITVAGSYNAPGTNQSVSIRGAGSGRTLITIDGVPVGDPTQTDNSFDINLIPVAQIERIEISKGAQSTLYGSDAIAGVVNIITVKPDITKPVGGKASFAGGNYGTYNGNAQLYGNLANQLTYNLRYTRASTDGFSRARDTSTHTPPAHPFDNDGYKSDVLGANLGWTPVSALTLKGFFQYSNYKTDIDQGAFRDAWNYTSGNKNVMIGGGFTYNLANTVLHGNYLYNTTKRNLAEDSIFHQSYSRDSYFGTSQYAELFASTNLGYGLTLLNGADYKYSSMSENGIYGTYPSTFKDTNVSQTSMYSSLFYTSNFGLSAELGGRLNTHSRYGSNYTYTFNPAFLIDENWKLYGSIASGFKAPSLYQLYSPYGNTALVPEKSNSYEGGVQFSNKIVEARGTYFHRKTKDALDFNNFTYQYFNRAEEKGHGIELETKIRFTEMVTLSVNYTWQKIRQNTQSHESFNDTTYAYALRTPENMLNFTLGVKPVRGLYVSVSGHYESKRHDLGGYMAPDVLLNDFIIFNAYAEYKPIRMLKLFAETRNFTNKKFFTLNGYNSIPAMFTGGAAIEF
ncbi:MAG: TonB-dependent receptor [Bacteroidetes bacterium]|nr:TonB-dependent receptor [Bacteroidota bacterium]